MLRFPVDRAPSVLVPIARLKPPVAEANDWSPIEIFVDMLPLPLPTVTELTFK